MNCNKKYTTFDCNKNINCTPSCDHNYKNPCSHCNKYTEISNEKCRKAILVNEEANKAATCAANLEKQAEELQIQINKLICESQKYWEKYNQLSMESAALMKEAQIALHEGIECQKDCIEQLHQGCTYNTHCCKKHCGCY